MSSSWTDSQNKLFETVMAIYDKDTPDRWHNVARAVGCGKTAEDVERHFRWLNRDVQDIDSGIGSQGSDSSSSGGSASSSNSYGRNNGDKRTGHPKPQ